MADKPKRALPTKVAAMKAKKRQRSETEGRNNAQSKRVKIAPRRKMDLQSLPWKSVSMPDRLEDYEGFFGLEEIDHIEVTRDLATGKISFHLQNEHQPTRGDAADEAQQHAFDLNDDDSWSGFQDEDMAPEEVIGTTATRTTGDKQKQQKQHKSKNKKKSQSAAQSASISSASAVENDGHAIGAFSALPADAGDVGVDVTSWKPLKLSPNTLSALSKMKFSAPTTIQLSTIPEVLRGHDVIGKASTGSGKTLAFGIPILERFLETLEERASVQKVHYPIALVLSPTRELAHQLEKHMNSLFQGISVRKPVIATLTGGLSLQKQQRVLSGADVVVGTPGRLWEVIGGGRGIAASLKRIEFLVIDEADRLLSEGHFKEVEEILNALDREDPMDEEEGDNETGGRGVASAKSTRQTLVFSATFDRGLQKKLLGKSNWKENSLSNEASMGYLLSKLNFRDEVPKYIDANPVNQLANGLREGLIECAGTEKDLYLYTLLMLHSSKRTLVFTNSISAVRRITPLLQNLGLDALPLNSGMIQKARLRSIERFSRGNGPRKSSSVVLIATDVAARGLDIPNVDLVIHYHLPRTADAYVHRSGRTARAGQRGSSVLICGPEEVAGVRRLIAKVHARSVVVDSGDTGTQAKQGFYIRTLDMDRKLVTRLKERLTLAKKLTDAAMAKEKQHKSDDWMRSAAEELGVDYDSEEFEKQATGKRGRGSGRQKKEREARGMTKAEIGAIKAELKALLRQPVNVGVSERYLTSGRVDVDELLRQQDAGEGKTVEFLGSVGNLGLEDI